ncbi:hypothetical protein D1B31_18010 [Neobacillus notoginsengisoli]|uniref:Recombinase n=1 Tax=Neobacillus notoginsengisoli TaxID=1578198 RepID=A0A417YQC1_9BACI|nr:Rad52/Rad22 family DNA repair protein [Neobacillus notoginsengisoli]RHW35983.1 hypothetical protein D1B31_18010 [Neobacillus notoginsengisoli]
MKKDCTADEIMTALQEPFSAADIEWRVSHSGVSKGKPWAMVLAYVTNRAIQNRLDDVFGPAGWKNRYADFQEGIICTISCLIEGQWIDKSDGAEKTDFEALKGGLSNAMKRAAVQWGIGRYLYKLEASFVDVFNDKRPGSIRIYDKRNNVQGYWFPPRLPDWALPANERGKGQNSSPTSQQPSKNQGNKNNPGGKNTNNQQGNKNARPDNSGKGFNRQAASKAIVEFLTNTGLKDNRQFIMPLFKRINPGLKQKDIKSVLEQGTENELKMYYGTLKPVSDLVLVTKHYNVSLEDALHYAQILLPEVEIKTLFSCLMNLKHEHVKTIAEFIKEDLKNGNIQKIA